MATGTGNLPYITDPVSPFDTILAETTNEHIANIEALADGSGIGDGAIGTDTLAQSAVTADKTAFGGSYSATEVNTGFKWTNGKEIYKKTVDIGSLPNNTTKSVAHGISGLDLVVLFTGRATSGSTLVPLPWVHASPTYISITGANIDITSTANRSAYSGSVDLYYTKT